MTHNLFPKKAQPSAEAKLKRIKELLYPPLVKEEIDGNVCFTDSTIYSNLLSIMVEAESGVVDEISINTISRILHTLEIIREILGVEEMDLKDATHYAVALPEIE